MDGDQAVCSILQWFADHFQSNLSVDEFRFDPENIQYLNLNKEVRRNQIKIDRAIFVFYPVESATRAESDSNQREVGPFMCSDTLESSQEAINNVT